ncbi:phosphoglycerate mutase family protein [Rhodopila sp.]|uniref:phosphoglycerate mutase family protein n=1 Tax=Rhodopila sp. TaxID=2480087 RepID=UPI003D0D7CEC
MQRQVKLAAIEILLLRHAEKPDHPASGPGLTTQGQEDAKSLTVRGWQRAGALAALFAPNLLLESRLPTPNRIYASAWREGGGHSQRPEQTVEPLARKLNCPVDLTWALHQEEAFGVALAASSGTALVCWQHQGLAALARAIVAPQCLSELLPDWSWPADCYDVIWSLRRNGTGKAWHFTQYCQALLSGDRDQPFNLPGKVHHA